MMLHALWPSGLWIHETFQGATIVSVYQLKTMVSVLWKKKKTCMNYWILCKETPQRLKTKAELKDWRALLCVLVCKVWAWTCLTTCSAPDTALITHQSVATNRHTAQREDDKHQLPSVSLTGNRFQRGPLWRQVAKWSHPQSATMWRSAAPFATKCFFVQCQWSCTSAISRRIGSEDPSGRLV